MSDDRPTSELMNIGPMKNNTQYQSLSRNSKDKVNNAGDTTIDTDNMNDPLIKYAKNKNETGFQKCCRYTKYFFWTILGIFLLFGATIFVWAPDWLDNFIRDGITEQLVLTSDSTEGDAYKTWVSNNQEDNPDIDSIPLIVAIQFYNVTNPREVLLGENPQFRLTPPIVYTQWYYRTDIEFSEDGTMVRSKFNTQFIYNEELSEIAEDEVFSIVAPLAGGLHDFWKNAGRPEGALWAGAFELINVQDGLYTTDTARNLVFDIVNFEFGELGFQFGILNNNSGSYYVSHTGKDDIARMGETLKWSRDNGNISFDLNDIEGSFIDCWDPPLSYSPSHFIYFGLYRIKEDKYNIPKFGIATLSKDLEFRWDRECEFKGMKCEEYRIDETTQFYNVTQYPPNSQFYAFGKSGTWNMSKCFGDLPLFFSLPNFYGFPDFWQSNLDYGVREPIDSDLGYIRIEPYSGSIIDCAIPLMGSVPMEPLPRRASSGLFNYTLTYEPLPDEPSLSNIPVLQAPTYLLNYTAVIPDGTADTLSTQLNSVDTINNALYIASYVCIPLFLIWLSMTFFFFGKWYKERKMARNNSFSLYQV